MSERFIPRLENWRFENGKIIGELSSEGSQKTYIPRSVELTMAYVTTPSGCHFALGTPASESTYGVSSSGFSMKR